LPFNVNGFSNFAGFGANYDGIVYANLSAMAASDQEHEQ